MGFPAPAGSSATKAAADNPGLDPLVVGPVTFTSRECPQKLDLGAGDQLISDTKLTGGSRIVQSFGAFWKNVRFSGTFWENADARYAQLDALRIAGKETTISWRADRFYGFVIDLTPGSRNAFRRDYEIELLITRVANGPGAMGSAAPSLDTTVASASTNAATAYTSMTAIDATASTAVPSSLLSAVTAAINAAGPLAQSAGSAAATAILTAVSTATAAVSTYLAGLSSAPVPAPSYVPAKVLYNSLTLIAKNVQQGAAPNAVQQLGGSYFEAAVLAYGNIDQALALADANNAPSLRISSSALQSIVLPPLSSGSM